MRCQHSPFQCQTFHAGQAVVLKESVFDKCCTRQFSQQSNSLNTPNVPSVKLFSNVSTTGHFHKPANWYGWWSCTLKQSLVFLQMLFMEPFWKSATPMVFTKWTFRENVNISSKQHFKCAKAHRWSSCVKKQFLDKYLRHSVFHQSVTFHNKMASIKKLFWQKLHTRPCC